MPEASKERDSSATPSPRVKQLPSEVDPWSIANDPSLNRKLKLERLHQLEQDVRLVEVAQEEGMTGTTNLPSLRDVLAALDQVAGHGAGGAPRESDTKA